MERNWTKPAIWTLASLAAFLLMIQSGAVLAQTTRNVPLNIQPGEAPSTINGLVVGQTRLVHSVKVAAGQRLSVDLRSNNPELVFGIYARSGATVFEARRGQSRFSAVLRRSGTYAIIVSFTPNAPRKNAIYQLSVGLSAEDLIIDPVVPPTPPQPPIDQSELVRVVGIGANDTLAVRAGPGAQFEILGELSPGTRKLRLGNCRKSSSGSWCAIATTRSVPLSGWVNARFLSEDSP